jgi:hypothetical protein
MKIEKLASQELNKLELDRAKRLLTKLKKESALSDEIDWFCNGHSKISKEGYERFNVEAERAQKVIDKLRAENKPISKDRDPWYCNGHSK